MTDIDSAIVSAKHRATGYQNVDGLFFLACAVFSLGMGAISVLMRRTDSFWVSLALVAVIVGYHLLIAKPDAPAMRWLKSRVTYPRTGLVVPQPESAATSAKDWKHRAAKGAAVAAFALAAVISYYSHNRWIDLTVPPAVMVIVFIAFRTHPRTVLVWPLIPAWCLSAAMAAHGDLSRAQEATCLWFVTGILQLIVGATRLGSFLLRHRVRQA